VVNLDVFLRICVTKFVEFRLDYLNRVLSALKVLEFNNYYDVLFNEFEQAFKTHLGKSEKWCEAAYAYFAEALDDSYFTREDVVTALLPMINSTAFSKEYTLKHKAYVLVKE